MGVIKVQPNVNDKAMAREQRALDRAKAESFKAMKELRETRKALGKNKRRGLVGQLHYDALMNAVEQEGPEVLSAAGMDYFEHEARENPWMTLDGKAPSKDSINGHRCRIGKVKEKYMNGRWYHWDAKAGGWVPGEITGRKGVK